MLGAYERCHRIFFVETFLGSVVRGNKRFTTAVVSTTSQMNTRLRKKQHEKGYDFGIETMTFSGSIGEYNES